MDQNNTKQSGLRTLTQDEVNAVSGGFAVLPWIAGIVIKIIIASIVEGFDHGNKNNNNQNPQEPGSHP